MSKKNKKSGLEKPSKSKKNDLTDESEGEPDEYDPHATWDCTVCTFKNRFEAFKCEICDTRKGTSTRKPRVNSNVVQQQALVQSLAMDKAHKRHRLSTRGQSPDSQEAGPSSVNPKRESSVSSNIIPDIGSPSSTSSKDRETETPATPKREKLRDSLIFRDSAKKYEIPDDSGVSITITAFKGRNSDKELRYINALKEVSILRAKQKEKVEKARAENETDKKTFEETRAQSRVEKTSKPKKPKKVKIKKPKLPKKEKKVKTPKPAGVFKVPATRGRPSLGKTKAAGTPRTPKTTPGSSKKK